MKKSITVAEGDGIGSEIVPEAVKVLNTVADIQGHKFDYRYVKVGGAAFDVATAGMSESEKAEIDKWDDKDKRALSLPTSTIEDMDWARDSGGAILFGSLGRPDLPKRVAELGLLGMRKRYGVVNNRPFIIDPILAHNSILFRDPVVINDIQIMCPVEESLYNGEETPGEDSHSTQKKFTRSALEKYIGDVFEIAESNRMQVLCASKYNVLVSEKLLSEVFEEVAEQYRGRVKLNEASIWKKDKDEKDYCTGQLIIDNAGMQIAAHPERYDNTIVIADAMFGDFLAAIVDTVRGRRRPEKETLDQLKEAGVHRTFIRELCGGLYFGDRSNPKETKFAFDTMTYDTKTIRDIAKVARRVNAQQGLDRVDSLVVNGIPTFNFWKDVLDRDAEELGYNLRHLGIREGVETLLTDPYSLGTLITSNMMGDIYTDLAAAVVGKSLGIMPSSAVNAEGFGIYEQIAGSAPDIAGKGIANPIAEIRSAAMMLEDFGDKKGADMVYDAVDKALHVARTPDIWEEGYKKVNTKQMGDLICQYIKEAA